MKVFSKIIFAAALVAGLASCNKDYDLPPLEEPKFNIPEGEQTTTLLELKEKTKEASEETPVNISEDLWVKAVVSADDRSGNLYKSFVIQDNTSNMTFLVDMSGVSNIYPRGQEIIFNLKGMCVSVYGGQQQIGHPDGYLKRTPKAIFDKMIHKTGWPHDSNIRVKDYDNFSEFAANDVNAIVKLNKVHFKEAGNGKVFAKKGEKFGTCQLKDSFGNEIEVRTSSYATFANNEIPVGTGNMTALLGKFRDKWQITIVDFADLTDFDGVPVEEGGEVNPEKPVEPVAGTYYDQDFSTTTKVEKDGNFWPDFMTYVEKLKTPGKFATSGKFVSIRSVKDYGNNIWFGKGFENWIEFQEIDTKDAEKVIVSAEIAANLYNAGEENDLAALEVEVDGKRYQFPSTVKKDKDQTKVELTIPEAIATKDGKFTFRIVSNKDKNITGLRLFRVKVKKA